MQPVGTMYDDAIAPPSTVKPSKISASHMSLPDQTPQSNSHGHGHSHGQGASRFALVFALCLTAGYAIVEALAGWWAGSLALLGDAGHMITDSLALGLAAGAAWLARRPPSHRLTYGFGRAESLAALLNGILMLAVIVAISWHAILRLLDPQPVAGGTVTVVALIGLVINIGAAWLLSRGGSDLNTRAALLHVIGDLLGSVAALAAGLVIQFTGWMPIDPLLSMLICGLILASTVNLLRQVMTTLLDGVPESLSLREVGRAMAAVDGVASVHDLHIWSLGNSRIALSAHVVVAETSRWPETLTRLNTLLEETFSIDHSTLQPEIARTEPLVFKRSRE